MKDFLKNKPITLWETGVYILIVLAGLAIISWINQPDKAMSAFTKNEKAYETIHPRISKSFSTQKLIGKVSSNNFAVIHPRREGIIKDILVDVGDGVKAGQTIAYLFPPGVKGEGASQIAKAKAQLLSSQEELRNAKAVAGESVGVEEKKLSQTQTSLENVIGGGENTRSQIVQNYDQAEMTILQALLNVEWILFGVGNVTRSVNSIVGSFNNQLQESKVFNLFEETDRSKKRFAELNVEAKQKKLYGFLNQVEELLNETEILYRNADEGREHGSYLIEKHMKEIQDLQTKILKAQEMIDDILLTVDQLEVETETAQKSLSLAESQANKSIDIAYNEVEIAQAAYQNALVKNGHVQITSPFSGKISTKFVEVGHMVHPSKALFEIMEVNTTLGQVADLEVEFGIPEEFFESVNVGDKVEITLPMLKARSPIRDSQGLRRDLAFNATINRKSTQIDGASNTAIVHAILDEGESSSFRLHHNSNVYVHIQDTKNPVYGIPSYSIKKRRNQNFVFIKEVEGKTESFHKVEVQILAEDGEFSDVRSEELSLESNVVVNPSVRLFREVK